MISPRRWTASVFSNHQPFFDALRDIGTQVLPSSIQEHSTLLLAAIASYLLVSLDFLQNHYIVKVFKVIGKDDVGEAQKVVDWAIAGLDQAVGRETYLMAKRKDQEEKLEKAVVSLSKLDFRNKHDDVWKRRLGETGVWLLSEPEFLKWVDGTIKAIWCTGLPGAGKTFVFSTIVDYMTLKETRKHWKPNFKIGVAYIYCSYNDQRAQTLDALLSSVIQQLISSCPATSKTSDPLLQKALDFHEAHRGHSPSTSDYVKLLGDVARSPDRAFVLLDALDECAEVDHNGSNPRATLIRLLSDAPIQLLATSRQLESIKDLFPNTLEISIRPDRRDIQSYIKWRISDADRGSKKLLRLTQTHAGLQDQIIDTVFENFNLVRLQMDHIRNLSTIGELREALSSLPTRQEDFYDQSIVRIKDNEAQRDRAMKVLAWISQAKRPMKIDEILHAIAILPDRASISSYVDFIAPVEDVADSCEGLVLINHESNTLTFAHPTVKEYLEKYGQKVFTISPDNTISRTCLTYLLFEEMEKLSTERAYVDGWDKYALLNYASMHWSSHVHGEPEEEHIEMIMRIFHRQSKLGSLLPALQDPEEEDPLWRYWDEDTFEIMTDGVWLASALGLEKMVARLIKMAAEIDTNSGHYRRRAIHLATERGYRGIVMMLLQAGADIEGPSKYGRTALHLAAYNNDAVLTKDLVDAGANIQAEGKHGETALEICAECGFLETARVLLDAGAVSETEGDEGANALGNALTTENTEMIQLLMKAGAQPNFRKDWRVREEYPEFYKESSRTEEY